MKVRIESLKSAHHDILQAEGEVRVNGIEFTVLEGRLVTAPLNENQAGMFDGVPGFQLLREDLSVIRPTGVPDRAPVKLDPPPPASARVNTIGGKPVDGDPRDGEQVSGNTIGGKPVEEPNAAGETEEPETEPAEGDAAGEETGEATPAEQDPAGAPETDTDARLQELDAYTRDELRAAAAKFGIPEASKMNKGALKPAIAAREIETGERAPLPED